jgi:hypothetical protein
MEETLTTKGASDDLDDATSGPISPKGHPAIRIEISRRVRTMALCDCHRRRSLLAEPVLAPLLA